MVPGSILSKSGMGVQRGRCPITRQVPHGQALYQFLRDAYRQFPVLPQDIGRPQVDEQFDASERQTASEVHGPSSRTVPAPSMAQRPCPRQHLFHGAGVFRRGQSPRSITATTRRLKPPGGSAQRPAARETPPYLVLAILSRNARCSDVRDPTPIFLTLARR